MVDGMQIDKAIAAHGNWKLRLRSAIDTKSIDVPVEKIRTDNQCPFGEWLYGAALTANDKSSPHYRAVRELHAAFHQSAATVVELVMSGKQADAERMVGRGGDFLELSMKLTLALMEWKKTCV
jgi:chemoreceptor zinc-binding protein